MTPDVSVVCVTYNSREHIASLLSSLHEHTAGVEYEVVVVDNASSDGTAALVAEQFPDVRLICRTSNAGLSAGNNEGVAASAGTYVAVLNPDIRLERDALSQLVQYLRDHADVGVAAPKMLDDDGGLQMSCRSFPGYATALFSRYSLLSRLMPSNKYSRHYLMSDFDHGHTSDVDWASGAALVFPRAVFEEVGGWDAGLFLFSEDVDFCRRVHDAGYRVVYHPDAVVYHRIGISKNPSTRVVIERHRSMWRYYRKHMRSNFVFDVMTGAGIAARCAFAVAGVAISSLLKRRPA